MVITTPVCYKLRFLFAEMLDVVASFQEKGKYLVTLDIQNLSFIGKDHNITLRDFSAGNNLHRRHQVTLHAKRMKTIDSPDESY